MQSQMERYSKKATVFLTDHLIRYYDDHVAEKVQKVELVNIPDSTPVAHPLGNRETPAEQPSDNRDTPVEHPWTDTEEMQTTTENFF